MIISHKYQFIFIKTHKTAGTSIEIELSKYMGEDDIITPIHPPVLGHNPRNYKNRWSGDYFNHMSGLDIKKKLKSGLYDKYYKFCVEREPVDKCISFYSMLKNSSDHNNNSELTWDEYLAAGIFPTDEESYTDKKGNLIVDHIIKYENLDAEMAEIYNKFGINYQGINSKAKSGFREKIEVSDQDKKIIYDAFSASLKFTNY